MSRFPIVGLALGLAAMWALQGCGSGGGGSSGTTVTTTTTKAETTAPAETTTAPAATTTAPVKTTTTAVKKETTTIAPVKTTTTMAKKETTTTAPGTTTTTTTLKHYPGGLLECLDVGTYTKLTYSDGGDATFSGQCPPSSNFGAWYTKTGDKADDGKSDKPWGCFGETTPPDQWTNEFAKSHGYEGACLFGDHNNTVKPDEIEDCRKISKVHPSRCMPGPSAFWGACYSETSYLWRCIPKGLPEIEGDTKGDCKNQAIVNETGQTIKQLYDGVCRFPEEKQEIYKCDTVPGYSDAEAGTCGGGPAGNPNNGNDQACFSLKQGTNWVCANKDSPLGLCDWTPTPDSMVAKPVYYEGKCVLKGSKEYDDAKEWKKSDTTIVI